MKITIYELLGLVKDSKAPKKIKYYGKIYEYSENDGFYYWEGLSLYREFATNGNCLDKEVEIIDDEEWRTIFDFPNYEVSNKGNIRSKEYNDSLGHLRSSKKLKKKVNNCG